MTIPAQPKIYHIVHVDRLPSIIAAGLSLVRCRNNQHSPPGTAIGMNISKNEVYKN